MIDKSFIEKIESMAAVEVKEIDGRKFSTNKLFRIMDPQVDQIEVHTLTGLVDYFDTMGAGDASTAPVQFHVKDFNQVAIISPVFGVNKQRETHIEAKSYDLKHKFNDYYPVEDFIVNLQSVFVQDDTTANILKIVGNLTQGSETNIADDGMTQRVTAKAGVARVETVNLPNPVTLRPFRTFTDIDQPESKFVLRIKADGDRGPKCALFEADGGAWKNKAIASIKDYLEGRKVGLQVIA